MVFLLRAPRVNKFHITQSYKVKKDTYYFELNYVYKLS